MKALIGQKELENLNLMQKRVEFLIGARVQNRKQIHSAVQAIDKLRSKTSKNWNSVEEIRKWRDKR